MEIFELRYFLAVARFENIHRASEQIGVSPGSLSKAITRIEGELETNLFERQGRNIKLSAHGKMLLERAAQIVELEEAAQIDIKGKTGELAVSMAGPEVLMARFGSEFSQVVNKKYPSAKFTFVACDEAQALAKVASRESHLALTTQELSDDFETQTLGEAQFVTVAGARHAALAKMGPSKIHPVASILELAFVSPNSQILGRVGAHQSLDGWRDDKFPRRIKFSSSSLRLIEEIVSRGDALAYLPDYIAESYLKRKDWQIVKISGCPYTCKQKIKLVVKKPVELGWLRQVF
jgi:DNA-binding transcriptional LysR family regulator